MPIDGLDVSQWQGPINWPQVPATYQWVAIRALRGLVVDSRFHENWEGARLRGFRYRLAYAYITGTAPRAQAHALLDLVGPLRVGEGMMQDFEDPPVTNLQARDWLEEVEGNTGRPAVEYLGGTLERKRARLTVVGDRPLVWPDYRSEALARATLPDWCDAWQFTDRGTVPGISGPVDLDRIDNPAAFDAAVGVRMAWQNQMPKVVMPADLAGQLNGRLDPALLDSNVPGGGGAAHHLAARAWRAMHAAAMADGVELKSTGNYRTFTRQKSLFLERYSRTGTFGDCKTCGTFGGPEFQGRWCKKGNFATAACPGTSNHGWGLAFDTAAENDEDNAPEPLDSRTLRWLEDNAVRFGFGWELPSENWHVRYYRGDAIPIAVLMYEASPVPVPVPVPTPGDDMILARFQCRDADAAFIGAAVPVDAANAVPLTVVWADSDTDADYAQWVQHRQDVNAVDARDWTLIGRLPVQDSRKIWVNTDFRQVVPAA